MKDEIRDILMHLGVTLLWIGMVLFVGWLRYGDGYAQGVADGFAKGAQYECEFQKSIAPAPSSSVTNYPFDCVDHLQPHRP